jgi:sulfur carrier protein
LKACPGASFFYGQKDGTGFRGGRMNITVNGKREEVTGQTSLLDFLAARKIHPDKVVVELNMIIIEKNVLADTIIRENDQIEILRFVGGG